MKQTLGYGIKLSNESLKQAALSYVADGSRLHRSKKEALNHIKRVKKMGGIGKKEKGEVFKIVVESK